MIDAARDGKRDVRHCFRRLKAAAHFCEDGREGRAMRLSDFSIGLEFSMSGARWRCTDVGRRTVIAIKLERRDASWYRGPPYAVAEVVLDEYALPACTLEPELEDCF